jgi:hypothetical protein
MSEQPGVDLAEARALIQALAPGFQVTVERHTPFAYRVTVHRGSRSGSLEFYPGPEHLAEAFAAWVRNPEEDPADIAGGIRALAAEVLR